MSDKELVAEIRQYHAEMVELDGGEARCWAMYREAADTIDRLTRERDEARRAGFEAAREEAAKVAEEMAAELARLKGSGDRRVQIGSHLETCATIEAGIRSLSPPEQGQEQDRGGTA